VSSGEPALQHRAGDARDDPQRWLPQTAMTDPRGEASMLEGLPDDLGRLCRAVQGALVHLEWLEAYGLTVRDLSHVSRDTLSVASRLRAIKDADPSPLLCPRAPAGRSPGTCRDYALMLCGLLRHQHIPARVRCGFATYFRAGRWEDHWICEVWFAAERRWRRVDAQLDEVLIARLGITFDPTDLPSGVFMPAPDAWLRCRTGNDDANVYGHGEACGLWFMRVNVMRDHLVLNGAETSNWDTWRNATNVHRLLGDDELRTADAIASHPVQPARPLAPPWAA
jgi:hypothetical protein